MIRLNNVRKSFYLRGRNRIDVIKHASLELPEAGMVFVLGKSGAGKSTFLNLIGGLISPSAGSIVFSGFKGEKPKISFCFQGGNVFGELTVLENVLIAKAKKEKESVGKAKDILAQIGLSELSDRKAYMLSGGEQQRLALARALYQDSDVVLADEPTGSLDRASSLGVFNLLKEISDSRLVLVVSHDQEAAEKYGDRIIRIEDGIITDAFRQDQIVVSDGLTKLKDKLAPNPGLVTKIAWRQAFRRPLALLLTILLTGLSLGAAMFGFGLGIGASDTDVASSVIASGIDSIVALNTIKGVDVGFGPLDLVKAGELCKAPCVPLYNIPHSYSYDSYSYRLEVSKPCVHNPLFQSSRIRYCFPTNLENLKNVGLDLIAGALPTGLSEIAIPYCQYEEYANAGFLGTSGGIPATAIADPASFLSYHPAIYVFGRQMEIVGIVDTHLPEKLFSYVSADERDFFGNICQSAYKTGIENSLHVCAFGSQDFCDNFAKSVRFIEIPEGAVAITSWTAGQSSVSSLSRAYSAGVQTEEKEGIFASAEMLRASAGSEVNAPFYDFENASLFRIPRFSSVTSSETSVAGKAFAPLPDLGINNAFVLSACCDYVNQQGLPSNRYLLEVKANEDFLKLKAFDSSVQIPDFGTPEGEDVLKTYFAWSLSMGDFGIEQYPLSSSFYNDVFDIGITGETIVRAAAIDLLRKNDLFPKGNVSLRIEGDFNFDQEFPCAGIAVLPGDGDGERCYLTDGIFEKVAQALPDGRTMTACCFKTPSLDAVTSLFSQYKTSFGSSKRAYRSEIAQFSFAQDFKQRFENLQNVMIWLSVGLFSFNILLQVVFALIRLDAQGKTAGLLLGIGGRLAHLYLFSSFSQFISSVIGCLVGATIAVLVSASINANFMAETGLMLPVFTFPVALIVTMGLGSIALVLLMCFVNSVGLKKKGAATLLKRE